MTLHVPNRKGRTVALPVPPDAVDFSLVYGPIEHAVEKAAMVAHKASCPRECMRWAEHRATARKALPATTVDEWPIVVNLDDGEAGLYCGVCNVVLDVEEATTLDAVGRSLRRHLAWECTALSVLRDRRYNGRSQAGQPADVLHNLPDELAGG